MSCYGLEKILSNYFRGKLSLFFFFFFLHKFNFKHDFKSTLEKKKPKYGLIFNFLSDWGFTNGGIGVIINNLINNYLIAQINLL